jgi:hypothetical protein
MGSSGFPDDKAAKAIFRQAQDDFCWVEDRNKSALLPNAMALTHWPDFERVDRMAIL